MAVTLQCARCMHEQKIEDDRAEAGVPCRICHHLIKAGAQGKPHSKVSSGNESEGIKSGPPAPAGNQQTTGAGKKSKLAKDDDDEDRSRSKKKRRDRDSDDDDDDRRRPVPRHRRAQEGSSSMMFILLGGGVFVLLALVCGGGIGAYALFGGPDARKNEPIVQNNAPRIEVQPAPIVNPNPNPFPPVNPGPIVLPNPNPFPGPNQNPFQQENLDPNNPNQIDRVIALLQGPGPQRGPAYTWLKAANPEHARRHEVATLLEGQVNEYIAAPPVFGNDGMFDAFFRWATANNVPALINVVDKTRFTAWDNRYRQDAMKTLAKLKDPRGAEAIVRQMSNFFNQGPAKAALKEMGPVAEPAIVEAMNATADNNARKMYVATLGEMGTRKSIPALQQIAARFPQQAFFKNDVDRAIKAIDARGK